MKVLTIDVGGTSVKLLASGMDPEADRVKLASGPGMGATEMVEAVQAATAGWDYEAVSIGYPGPVLHGTIMAEPHNLAPGWVGFDFAAGLGRPVRVVNDAAMQALGSYEGGHMLFLGLGTGLGSALVLQGVVAPLELAHLPYRKGRTFEDYVGLRGYERLGPKRWRRAIDDVVARLRSALVADYVVLGGGNSLKLKRLPEGCRRGDNHNAFTGGFRLWHGTAHLTDANRDASLDPVGAAAGPDDPPPIIA